MRPLLIARRRGKNITVNDGVAAPHVMSSTVVGAFDEFAGEVCGAARVGAAMGEDPKDDKRQARGGASFDL